MKEKNWLRDPPPQKKGRNKILPIIICLSNFIKMEKWLTYHNLISFGAWALPKGHVQTSPTWRKAKITL